MIWIAIIGPDGAGKSTVIEGVEAYLNERELDHEYHHWCPKLAKTPKPYTGDATDPHSQIPRGGFTSYLKLLKLLICWWRFKVKGLRGKLSSVVILDRFYGDLLVDPIRYRYGGRLGFAKLAFKIFPSPDKIFLLDAEADVLYARKQEVELGRLKELVKRYREYALDSGGTLIDAAKPVDEVIKTMCEELDIMIRSKG